MEQVTIEKDDTSRRNFDRDGIIIRIRKLESFAGAVKTPVVVTTLWPDDTMAMRTGDDPQTAIFDRGIIQSHPGGVQRAVSGGDEAFILMPGLARFAGRFDE